MPRKSAAEKAAEEAAAVEAARRQVEQQRLKWIGAGILALALFAGGFAVGQSKAVGDDFGRGWMYEDGGFYGEGEIPPIAEIPMYPYDSVYPPMVSDLRCEIVEADGRTLHLVCDGPPVFGDLPGEIQGQGFLGVGVRTTESGVRVDDLAPGSPAAEAGIEIGDLIVGFDDFDIESAEQLADLIAMSGPGTEVEIRLLRFDSEVTVRVILAERG